MQARTDEADETAVAFLRTLAEVVIYSLTIENKLWVGLSKISQTTWQKIFESCPQWYDYYFKTPLELIARFRESPLFVEAFACDPAIVAPGARGMAIMENAVEAGKEAAAVFQQLASMNGIAEPDTTDPAVRRVLEDLILAKATFGETRARAFYGQGMLSLINAGRNGNDEGYFRAAAIDPAIAWHPLVLERIARERLVGYTTFSDELQKRAKDGPSKGIQPELHQLRYLLGFLRELGILGELSNAERFELLYTVLGLYPHQVGDKATDPKAALCTFIKRWERSIVT